MKGSIRLLTALCLTSLVVGGCRRGSKGTATDSPDASQNESASNSTTAPTPSAIAGGPLDQASTDAASEAWFKKYGLNLNDPKMLDDDPDGDGYTNREEFLADTNPKDPESRPGVHPGIRLKEFTEIRVPFMLKSVEGETAKIEYQEGGEGRVETVRAGQTLHGSTYKVQKVESLQTQDKDGNPIDASKVSLEDAKSSQKVDLVKGIPARSSASYAVLVANNGKGSLTVKQGDLFEWPGDKTAHYRVVDLRTDQVILEQVENKKMWTVPKK